MELPESYVVNKFYQFAGGAKFNRFAKTYQASCPICREGSNWLKKRRLYFIPTKGKIFCHNCGWSGSPFRWIKEVSGLSRMQILQDSEEYETFDANQSTQVLPKRDIPTLPGDCVNLFDNAQVDFYKDNKWVTQAIEYIKRRRLDVAANKPNSLYMCFDQYGVHDKRIIIPFVDTSNKIVFYQSRGFLPTDTKPKYLSKSGGDRSIFNLNKLSSSLNTMFVFEGPFNAFFMQNSVAVGGIQEESMQLFSSRQSDQVEMFCKFFEVVWVLDSQWVDSASYKKTAKLIEMKQKVFIWPESIGKRYKDFNDLCIALSINEICPQVVINNTFEGIEAKVRMSRIPQPN